MKNTFYYNFLPTKAEEEACKANKTPYKVTRALVDMRDIYPPPLVDFQKPWQIKRTLTHYEAVTGRVVVSFIDTMEHVFRYWTLGMANGVVLGDKVNVILCDVTDQSNPKRYCSTDVFFERLPNDDFILACMELFKDRSLSVGDEIVLFWDPRVLNFQFKLLRRAI